MEEVFTLEHNGFTVEVTVSEAYDTLKNTSDVTVGLRVKSAYKKGIHYPSGSVKLGGTALVTMNSAVSTHNIPITAYNTWYDVVKSSDSYTDSPWTQKGITHNTDGSKTVTLELELRGYDAGGYLSFQVADSRAVTLTHIPRASTIGATDADIGAVSMIAVSRKSTAYTHSIAYAFGSLKGYLTEDGGLSDTEEKMTVSGIAFLVPETFYAQIPDSPTGRCTLTCKTYSGTTQVGDAQTAVFTVTAGRALCAPHVSGTVADSNAAAVALTGDENILIRYISNALCAITAEAKNGASIAQKTVGGVAVENSRTLEAIEQGSVTFACTDSRGYGNAVTVEKEMIPYIHLTANVTAKRTDPTSGNATLCITGSFYQGSFGAAANILNIEYRVNGGEAVILTAQTDGNSYKVETALSGLDYQSAHTIEVTACDCLETVTKSVAVGKGIPVFDWGEADFQFHVPVNLNGFALLNAGGIDPAKESAYAAGCYYRTVDGVTEWINPPMAVGVEYRTAGRWNGKPVYTKLVDMGVPSETTTSVYFCSSSKVNAIGFTGHMGARALPIFVSSVNGEYSAYLYCIENIVRLIRGSALTGVQTYAQVWYVKEE